MTNVKHLILTERDVRILAFVWRHRLSTFRLLKEMHFSELSHGTAYNRCRRLRDAGYLRTDFLDGTRSTLWCLGERGFRFLETNELPELKVNSYKPQSKAHDLLAFATLLGDWRTERPKTVRIFSEQEIACLHLDELPSSSADSERRIPDGIWLFEDERERKAVALEVELTAKSTDRYQRICLTYSSTHFYTNVVWVVPRSTLAERILKVAGASDFARKQHLFIKTKDIEERGWHATFLNVDRRTQTLGMFLRTQIQFSNASPVNAPINALIKTPVIGAHRSTKNPFFDFSVFPKKSGSHGKPQTSLKP